MVRRGVCIGKGWREMPKVGKLMKHRRFSHGVVAAALLSLASPSQAQPAGGGPSQAPAAPLSVKSISDPSQIVDLRALYRGLDDKSRRWQKLRAAQASQQ